MEKSYDLTTYKGVNKALDIFKKYGWVINPIPWLVYKALSPELSTEKQVEAARTLIEAGKKNGVKRMKIKIGHKAGLELSTLLQGFPIKVMIGNDGIAEVEVDYESNDFGNSSDVKKT